MSRHRLRKHVWTGETLTVAKRWNAKAGDYDPVVMKKPLCGRWMYDEGQFLNHEDRHQTSCDHCRAALERREAHDAGDEAEGPREVPLVDGDAVGRPE